jgi:hypothetical protein
MNSWLLVSALRSNNFGQTQKNRKEIEIRHTIRMDISPFALKDTVSIANTTDGAGSVLHTH